MKNQQRPFVLSDDTHLIITQIKESFDVGNRKSVVFIGGDNE